MFTVKAMWEWELAGLGCDSARANKDIQNYGAGLGIRILFLDVVPYLGLYYCFDNVVPYHGVGAPRKPWFLCLGGYWREATGRPPIVEQTNGKAGPGDAQLSEYREAEDELHLEDLVQQNKCVLVRNLNKSFANASGEKFMAVDNLSLPCTRTSSSASSATAARGRPRR